MCSTPARSAASIALVSSVDLIARRRAHEEQSSRTRARRVERRGIARGRPSRAHALGPRRVEAPAARARTRTPRSAPSAARRDLRTERTGRPDHHDRHGEQSPHRDYRAHRARASPGPGIGRELTVQQELACALRILAHEGWRENLVGPHHVVDARRRHVVQPVGHLVGRGAAPPTSCASTPTATIVEGDWDVTPAVFIHTELHRARARRRASSCTTTRTTRRCSSTMRRAAAHRAPELVHLRRRARVRRRVRAASRTPTTASGSPTQVGDASGDPARAPRRDRHRADDRGRVLQGGDVRAHVPVHLRHRSPPGRDAVGDPGRRSARR